MTFDDRSDRDLLIETVTTVRELKSRMDERERDHLRTRRDVEGRLRALERLRWAIWGAFTVSAGAAAEIFRSVWRMR